MEEWKEKKSNRQRSNVKWRCLRKRIQLKKRVQVHVLLGSAFGIQSAYRRDCGSSQVRLQLSHFGNQLDKDPRSRTNRGEDIVRGSCSP